MDYRVTFRKRASEEYLDALLWYKYRSIYAAENFVIVINETIKNISLNPKKYKNTYKEFYEAKTKKYPFSIVYFIDEEIKTIVIVSIFHFKRNPRKKFNEND
jgi:plasmid stabilization system protein ParE